jgi:hypothetical protein
MGEMTNNKTRLIRHTRQPNTGLEKGRTDRQTDRPETTFDMKTSSVL